MRIAVFSDSHDHMDHISQAIEICKAKGITEGFHLGDFCAPPAVVLLATSGITWRCVWGNVDGDKLLAYQRVAEYGTVDLANNDFRELIVDGKSLFLTHYPEIARIAALSGNYDATFHGHNHQAASEYIAANGPKTLCLLANPGELAGFRFGKPGFGIYDTATNSFEHIWLDGKPA